jgi:hypothetical protein
MTNKFYVYALLDPRKSGKYTYEKYSFNYEPFYIGKGTGTRCQHHTGSVELGRCRNPHNTRKIRKILKAGLKPIIKIILDCLPESMALKKERRIIKIIGRRNLRNGPLTNIDEGGRVPPRITNRIKKLISYKKKLYYKTHRHPWTGRSHSEESRKRIRENHSDYWLGRKHKKSSKIKIGRALKGRRYPSLCNTYKIESPCGKTVIISNGIEKFCEKNNLTVSCFRKVITGTAAHHKGWKNIVKIKTVNSGKKEKFIVTSPLGKKEKIVGLSNFCRRNNLQLPNMIKVSMGLRNHHKGWKCKSV